MWNFVQEICRFRENKCAVILIPGRNKRWTSIIQDAVISVRVREVSFPARSSFISFEGRAVQDTEGELLEMEHGYYFI